MSFQNSTFQPMHELNASQKVTEKKKIFLNLKITTEGLYFHQNFSKNRARN